MLRFKEFLAEAFLIEGKIDDLKAQNPGLHHEIDQYTAADTSATKKFVPWLVSQHKKGNVTPNNPDLHQTIQNFDRYKNLHGIKDHSSRSFQEVRDAVLPLVGKGATKREVAEEGREKIHDSGDVQAYHIKTKEASQHFYGGGPEAGPTNTNWCVSARSKGCRFRSRQYGEMYTIHSKGDPNSPYAIHPEINTITNRHNDGDRDIDQEMNSKPEIAKLKSAIEMIQKHHDPVAYHLKTAGDISNNEIDDVMSASDEKHKTALVRNPNSQIALAALNHKKSNENTTYFAAKHPDPQVALATLKHPKVNEFTINVAIKHPNPQVAIAALNHPMLDPKTLNVAVLHKNPDVALAALNNPNIDPSAINNAALNKNSKVAMAALNHPKADRYITAFAIGHPDPQVRAAAEAKMDQLS